MRQPFLCGCPTLNSHIYEDNRSDAEQSFEVSRRCRLSHDIGRGSDVKRFNNELIGFEWSFDLLNIDWSLWPAPADTINCVGDLFMQYLYKVHAPIIPPDIGRY